VPVNSCGRQPRPILGDPAAMDDCRARSHRAAYGDSRTLAAGDGERGRTGGRVRDRRLPARPPDPRLAAAGAAGAAGALAAPALLARSRGTRGRLRAAGIRGKAGRPIVIAIAIARSAAARKPAPACDYYAATFSRLFTASCTATRSTRDRLHGGGRGGCRFEVAWDFRVTRHWRPTRVFLLGATGRSAGRRRGPWSGAATRSLCSPDGRGSGSQSRARGGARLGGATVRFGQVTDARRSLASDGFRASGSMCWCRAWLSVPACRRMPGLSITGRTRRLSNSPGPRR